MHRTRTATPAILTLLLALGAAVQNRASHSDPSSRRPRKAASSKGLYCLVNCLVTG
jgi:hypothetical protein